jgi:hypothetical protein
MSGDARSRLPGVWDVGCGVGNAVEGGGELDLISYLALLSYLGNLNMSDFK